MAEGNARSNAAPDPAARELVLTRIVDAPRSLVFRAWTDPQQLQRWWGPKGFTNPRCEIDPRPGGAIRIDMRGPDGRVYPMAGEYREVVEPERLVFTSAPLDANGAAIHEGLNTVTFVEKDGRATVTVRVKILSATPEAAPYLKGMNEGWAQTIDRLVSHATEASASDREIVAVRLLDAPRELVFDAFTDREHISRWWGPRGFTTTTHQMDVRPGGVWRFVMHGPDGVDYQNKVVYEEVRRPERLVYSHVSGPSFRATVTFAVENGKTRLTMRMVFESAAERERVAEKFGAVEGLHQTLDRLTEHVKG